ncbi:MAG: 2-succinyl-5-enolpyruvyl-6-hydroxy-3-cyclohexene-1-carboxylic-acid synthase [Bacteroidales bacterium]|nr:2-succinyl-5-enolpyruvyl-6-hydroxy-3-cyclohexene-1-carboxylic-acid synthase [Bacteroidales bacterium]
MLVTSLLYRFGIKHVVVCPGSRNAPLVDAFARCKETYAVYPVTDERSAGFIAIGMAESTRSAVAVCVTSGTAVANLYPSVVEAYHRNVPLVVVSADRPMEWIDQMDGQTMAQAGAYGRYADYCDILPENGDEERRWYNNREMNRVLGAMKLGSRPIHINIQLREPLFDFEPTQQLIDTTERVVEADFMEPEEYTLSAEAIKEWCDAKRRMIIVGQHEPDENLSMVLDDIALSDSAVILAESLSNVSRTVLTGESYDITPTDKTIAPDMVVYIGGHIVNKQLKLWLRTKEIKTIWRVDRWRNMEMPDTFGNLTRHIRHQSSKDVLEALADTPSDSAAEDFVLSWKNRVQSVGQSTPQCKMVHELLQHAGAETSNVVLANSSEVRYAQTSSADACNFAMVTCNRGVNGIEGTISQAVGCALGDKKRKTIVLTGDLSFFYDHNALWNTQLPENLRIVLINDHGGNIFRGLKGLEVSPVRDTLVMAKHSMSAEGWCADCGVAYKKVAEGDIDNGIDWLLDDGNNAKVLELSVWV